MLYDRDQSQEDYDSCWDELISQTTSTIQYNDYILGPQGAAAMVKLPEEMKPWSHAIVTEETSVVPDLHTLLSNIPQNPKWYTLIDLCSAFSVCLSILIHSICLHLLIKEGNTITHIFHKALCILNPFLTGFWLRIWVI